MDGDSPEIQRSDPSVLAAVLAEKNLFRCSIHELVEEDGFQSSLVRRCVQTFRQVFSLHGKVVALRPKLALCPMNNLGNGCRFGRNCRSLHICANYLIDECDEERCRRGHRWDVKPNSTLVKELFLDHLEIGDLNNLLVFLQEDYARKGTKSSTHCSFPENEDSDNVDDSVESSEEPPVSPTVWSHYLEGEVDIPEICYDSVVGKCAYEETGCSRLHASLPFHWQAKEPGSVWYNLQPAQVECLELNYCDPAKERCLIPKLDPTVYRESECDLLVLMGRAHWVANFEEMTLSLSTDDELMLRRICVEHLDEVEQMANLNVWYYEAKEWLPYGFEGGVTSEEIECAFLNSKSSPFYFTTEKHTYTLDFESMNQINDTTGFTRRVRRRPQPHLKKEGLLGQLGDSCSSLDSSCDSQSRELDDEQDLAS